MNKFLGIVLIVLLQLGVLHKMNAQYSLEWQKSYGGLSTDIGHKIKATNDGGYIVSGFTKSDDTDVNNHFGEGDYWVFKIDSIGMIEWESNYGGSDSDNKCEIELTNDGGYIIAGDSGSMDFDVSINKGQQDIWVVKIDSLGIIQWERSFGGTDQEIFGSISQTDDDGYLLVGYSRSIDGDLDNSVQGDDYWVLKLDHAGNIEWKNNYGGSKSDLANKGIQTIDGNFLIVGWSTSNDGDISNINGGSDIWLIKLNQDGVLLWSKNYGGADYDVATSIIELEDGSSIIVGWSDKEYEESIIDHDYFIIKVDQEGNKLWEKKFGGSDGDLAFDVTFNDNKELIIVGRSNSSDGQVKENYGRDDILIIVLDFMGNLKWDTTIGGTGMDRALSVECTSDSGFILTGLTYSTDFDVTDDKGEADAWVVKFRSDRNSDHIIQDEIGSSNICSSRLYPNPTKNKVFFSNLKIDTEYKAKVYDSLGRLMLSSEVTDFLDISCLVSGHYIVQLNSSHCESFDKLLVVNE